jgi:hypothetical protein
MAIPECVAPQSAASFSFTLNTTPCCCCMPHGSHYCVSHNQEPRNNHGLHVSLDTTPEWQGPLRVSTSCLQANNQPIQSTAANNTTPEQPSAPDQHISDINAGCKSTLHTRPTQHLHQPCQSLAAQHNSSLEASRVDASATPATMHSNDELCARCSITLLLPLHQHLPLSGLDGMACGPPAHPSHISSHHMVVHTGQ